MALAAAVVAHAQVPSLAAQPETKSKKKHGDAAKTGLQPSQTPAYTIPVTPLGFAPPAQFYLGRRVAQVSLNFLDDEHLLFTFRVPGLIPRDAAAAGAAENARERRIRALVLALPNGQVTAEALWSVHDQKRYLWVLEDGHFLLRDRNMVQRGDAGLTLEPFLRFPGAVDYLELDPAQKLLVTDTTEPAAGTNAFATTSASGAVTPGTPPTAKANVTTEEAANRPEPQALLRILSMDTRSVELFSHVSSTVHLPVDGEGYYEALRSRGQSWEITHQSFRGPSRLLSRLDSACTPLLDAVAPGAVLATTCPVNGDFKLTLLTMDQQRLWEVNQPATRVWPLLGVMPKAGRFARSVIELTRSINSITPIDFEDLKGQVVQVFDLATGKIVLTAPTAPILDGGGNFALSPSGRRAAVLNDGAIQVFDLPEAPTTPKPPGI